jgi:hypothetical protein
MRGAALARLSSEPLPFASLERNLFAGLTLNNVLLIFDKIAYPDVDLLPWRTAVSFVSMMILLYGLIWEAE